MVLAWLIRLGSALFFECRVKNGVSGGGSQSYPPHQFAAADIVTNEACGRWHHQCQPLC